MLMRENHAAVAQDASLGLLLLRSRHVPRLLELLGNLKADWFTQLLARRARWLREDLETRYAPQEAARHARCIIALENCLKQRSK
jgi:hypothetical protein